MKSVSYFLNSFGSFILTAYTKMTIKQQRLLFAEGDTFLYYLSGAMICVRLKRHNQCLSYGVSVLHSNGSNALIKPPSDPCSFCTSPT